LVKNSETEISRCRAPISTAVTAGATRESGFFDGESDFVADVRGLCVAIHPLKIFMCRNRAALILAAQKGCQQGRSK
jgi:hypothetical protein